MGFIAGLIIGGAVGAGLALLYSPRSGRENREVLAEQGVELTGRVDEVLPGASETIRERTREIVEEQRQRLQRAAEEARRATGRARESLTERYQAARRTGSSEPTVD